MKNPSAWFESVGGAPPISAKVIGAGIHTVCSATGKIGAAGTVICYFGSHVAMMARAFYSNSPFFRGWGWQFIVGSASALENHLRAYACYIYGLCVLPSILSLVLRLLGIHEDGVAKEPGDPYAVKRPHQFVRRIAACLLLVPFLQVLLGALAGLMALVLVLVLMAVHALVGCRCYGGTVYFWMRIAMRIGVRRAVGRWFR